MLFRSVTVSVYIVRVFLVHRASSLLHSHFTVQHKKAIGSKWIFKIKTNPDVSVRHKACLVIKGDEQELGVGFGEAWARVAKLTSLRMVLALAAKYGLMLHHMGVTTAFLNPRVGSLVFMGLPPGTDWLDPAACIDSRMSVCRC